MIFTTPLIPTNLLILLARIAFGVAKATDIHDPYIIFHILRLFSLASICLSHGFWSGMRIPIAFRLRPQSCLKALLASMHGWAEPGVPAMTATETA